MKKFLLFLIVLIFVGVGVFYSIWRWIEVQSFFGTMSSSNISKEFEIKEGEGSTEVGENLESAKLVKDKNFFYYYVWKTETSSKLQAGTYELAPSMTIQQMVRRFTDGDIKSKILKLTIPEGYNNRKIIRQLRKIKPSITDEFENIVTCKCLSETNCECDVFGDKYDFISKIPVGVDIEGYLFPDTYFIDEEETGVTLASKFLNNFNKRIDKDLRNSVISQGKTLHEVVTMASIVEREVKTDSDRKIVSGIFWNRLGNDFPLQSCATLAYFLDVDKPQFLIEETKVESPYNTYINSGLPPGPISNPGIASIRAAVDPQDSDYYYFLNDAETGEIVFSRTNEEHVENKIKHGL
ncbi:MAG: endolytic transglycosylase MltG [Patescibacteria group bacterium]|nr:endolytic transglycosylase MltG [Patescibacteria group bacterium]